MTSAAPAGTSNPGVRTRPWGLLGLNLALLIVLGLVTFMPRAIGQFAPTSETLVVSGATGASTEQVLWMFNIQRMELIAVGWDRAGTALEPIDRRSVSDDVEVLRHAR